MNKWTNTKRVARYGLIGFIRNGFVSFSAILVMTITLFVIANILLSHAALNSTLQQLVNQVDVTVYFTTETSEGEVSDIKRALEALPEVALVSYTSREQALMDFRERHKADQLILQGLDELGENPLGASLSVRAKETSQYESIAKFLDTVEINSTSGVIIEKVNFHQNKAAIDRLNDIIATSRENSIARFLLFALATLVIVFITIRFAIYTAREEIGVMNIVGASRWYVRGPFVIAGALYGVISGLIVLMLLYPILLFRPVFVGLDATSEILFGDFDAFQYFTDSFPLLFLTIMGTGIVLGVLSSFFAVRRYLNV